MKMQRFSLLWISVLIVPLIDAESKCPDKHDICSRETCSSSVAVTDTMSQFSQNVDRTILEEVGGLSPFAEEEDTVELMNNFGSRSYQGLRSYETEWDKVRELDVCDKCLGINEDPKCDGDYISTKDFNKLEDLVINKTEEMAIYIDNSMKIYNDGLVLKIDDRLKEGNQRIIKKLMKQRLETDKWFKDLDDKLKDIYTNHAFLKINQKEMFSKLKGVSKQITALKLQLSGGTTDNNLQTLYGKDVGALEKGLNIWEMVEFHDNGVEYSAGHSYFKQYEKYYTDTVPFALSSFINMLTNKKSMFLGDVNVWTAGNGKYCKYKKYFDHLLSMSKIHRCELLHFKNDRCSNKDLRKFLEDKHKAKVLFEEHCWTPPSSIKMKLVSNGEQIFHNSLLTLKPNEKYLKVRCVVYDAKPAVKITWEYNGRKLDLKSDPDQIHCYDPEEPPKCDCIKVVMRKSESDASLTDTSSTLTVKVGQQDLNKLRCLARHAASSSPQRVLVTIKKAKKDPCLKRSDCPFRTGRIWRSLLPGNSASMTPQFTKIPMAQPNRNILY